MRNPICRRICNDVGPDELSAAEPDDDEGVEQVKTDSWNNEQVHGGNVRRVVAQEGSPSLAREQDQLDNKRWSTKAAPWRLLIFITLSDRSRRALTWHVALMNVRLARRTFRNVADLA